MRRPALHVFAAASVLCSACNPLIGNDPWTLATDGSGGTSTQGSGEGGSFLADSSVPRLTDSSALDTSSPRDGAISDTATAMGFDSTSPFDSSPPVDSSPVSTLDPCLVIPDAASPTCSPINSPAACPSNGFCAIVGPSGDAGRCSNCPPGGCSSELKQPCVTDNDCDIIFQCYCGECRGLCLLGTSDCGELCTDVGNDTWGVCLN